MLQGGNAPRNLIIYHTFFSNNGLQLVQQYMADPLGNTKGSFADTVTDLNVYYEHGTTSKLFDNICYVSMNKTLLRYLDGSSHWRTPVWLANHLLDAEKERPKPPVVYMSYKRLLEAIEYEIEIGNAGINVLYGIAMKLLHAIAESIRSQKPTEQNWNPAHKKFDPLLPVTVLDGLGNKLQSIKLKLESWQASLGEAAKWCRDDLPVIGNAIGGLLDAVADLLNSLADAVDTLLQGINKIAHVLKLANAFVCGVIAEVLEMAAGIADLIALLLYLSSSKPGRDQLLKSIEAVVMKIRENPAILKEKIQEGLEALAARYNEDVSDYGKAYNAGEDVITVLALATLIAGIVKAAKNIPKLLTKLKEWANKVSKKIVLTGKDLRNLLRDILSKDTKTDDLFRAFKKRYSEFSGEEILSIRAIKVLRKELLENFSIKLRIVDKDALLKVKLRDWNSRITKPAASFSAKEKTIFIRSEVSAYTIEHELYHMKLWYKMTQEFPELLESYKLLNDLQHEEYVLAQFMKATGKWSIIDLERDLKTINRIRTKEYSLPAVDIEYFKTWKLP